MQIASTSVFNSMQLNENVENETDSSENDEISDTKTCVAQEETQLSPLKKKARKNKFDHTNISWGYG